ncbi:GTP cyclohydrolase 1 type 2/Nif3 [Vararia minispora EC-137]|uniref:GTP cyclohydrolase 1 type 2/Nif3 n=1 Tax=Vararia minispora EC-137 TaxID=1314806 RepID=A0ACB8QK04_9AGAM|nr:GTP cyclohydrolase 1 type 2/Nif3 [Vararia minispora EC-137]
MVPSRFKLVFFVPISHTQQVLQHLFASFPTSLGAIGNYRQCAFLTRGTGQFMPVDAAQPTVGAMGALERVEEDRVEIQVNDSGPEDKNLKDAIRELKKVHPYEEVAYDVYRLENF